MATIARKKIPGPIGGHIHRMMKAVLRPTLVWPRPSLKIACPRSGKAEKRDISHNYMNSNRCLVFSPNLYLCDLLKIRLFADIFELCLADVRYARATRTTLNLQNKAVSLYLARCTSINRPRLER